MTKTAKRARSSAKKPSKVPLRRVSKSGSGKTKGRQGTPAKRPTTVYFLPQVKRIAILQGEEVIDLLTAGITAYRIEADAFTIAKAAALDLKEARSQSPQHSVLRQCAYFATTSLRVRVV